MMCAHGQAFAKEIARRLGVGVFWHRPNGFIEPPLPEEPRQVYHGHYPAHFGGFNPWGGAYHAHAPGSFAPWVGYGHGKGNFI